jgi:hypothetical protein
VLPWLGEAADVEPDHGADIAGGIADAGITDAGIADVQDAGGS